MRASVRCAAGLCVVLGCTARGEPSEPAPAVKAVRCVEVKRIELTDSVELPGTIAPLPDRDAQVAAQVSGRIVRVEVREGDAVKAGQVLAHVDAAQLLDQVHEADAVLARASAERLNADTTLTRVKRVFEHGIAARQEVDDASARASSALAGEAEAAAAAKRAHLQLERTSVVSPLDGVVLKLMKRSGELVDGTPATPIMEIGDPSQLELVADAPAADLVRLKRGDSASIALSALPGLDLRGHVSTVAPAVDRATGLGVVRVAIETAEKSAPPIGVYGTARVQTGAKRKSLVVPLAVLRGAAGNEAEVVVCGTDGRAHARKVRRGDRNGAEVEIAGGIAEGERVVIEPVLGVADGEPIKVLP
jgi:multidrug efflux system membrane fusion protein